MIPGCDELRSVSPESGLCYNSITSSKRIRSVSLASPPSDTAHVITGVGPFLFCLESG